MFNTNNGSATLANMSGLKNLIATAPLPSKTKWEALDIGSTLFSSTSSNILKYLNSAGWQDVVGNASLSDAQKRATLANLVLNMVAQSTAATAQRNQIGNKRSDFKPTALSAGYEDSNAAGKAWSWFTWGVRGVASGVIESGGRALVILMSNFAGIISTAILAILPIVADLMLLVIMVITPIVFLYGLIVPNQAFGLLAQTTIAVFILKMMPAVMVLVDRLAGAIYRAIGTSGSDTSWYNLVGSLGLGTDIALKEAVFLIALAGIHAQMMGITMFVIFKLGDTGNIQKLTELDKAAGDVADAGKKLAILVGGVAALATLGGSGGVLGKIFGERAKKVADTAKDMAINRTLGAFGLQGFSAAVKDGKPPNPEEERNQKLDAIANAAIAQNPTSPEDPNFIGPQDLRKERDHIRNWLDTQKEPSAEDINNELATFRQKQTQEREEKEQAVDTAYREALNISPIGPLSQQQSLDKEALGKAMEEGKIKGDMTAKAFLDELDLQKAKDANKAWIDTMEASSDNVKAVLNDAASFSNTSQAHMDAYEQAWKASADPLRPLFPPRTVDEQIDDIYRSEYGRPPTDTERESMRRRIEHGEFYGGGSGSGSGSEGIDGRKKPQTTGTPAPAPVPDLPLGEAKRSSLGAADTDKVIADREDILERILQQLRQGIKIEDLDRVIGAGASAAAKGMREAGDKLATDAAKALQNREQQQEQDKKEIKAEISPSLWDTFKSGAVGGIMASGALSQIPGVGNFLKEVFNEFTEAPERARAWANKGGMWKWIGARGDAARLEAWKKNTGAYGQQDEYRGLADAQAFTSAVKQASMAAAQAVAKAKEQQVVIDMKNADFKNLGREGLNWKDFQNTGLIQAVESLEQTLATSAYMTQGKIMVGDGKTEVKVSPRVIQGLVQSKAHKPVNDQLDAMLGDHVYYASKNKKTFGESRYSGSRRSMAEFIKGELDIDYQPNGYIKWLTGKERYMGMKGQMDAIREGIGKQEVMKAEFLASNPNVTKDVLKAYANKLAMDRHHVFAVAQGHQRQVLSSYQAKGTQELEENLMSEIKRIANPQKMIAKFERALDDRLRELFHVVESSGVALDSAIKSKIRDFASSSSRPHKQMVGGYGMFNANTIDIVEEWFEDAGKKDDELKLIRDIIDKHRRG